ncbi:hypothetical protein LX36DRAFT_234174 [Colletotrichum falcatum]|nr:hypothetical protein LX36DRAFT_234174 [Colletotrichum falcatum]
MVGLTSRVVRTPPPPADRSLRMRFEGTDRFRKHINFDQPDPPSLPNISFPPLFLFPRDERRMTETFSPRFLLATSFSCPPTQPLKISRLLKIRYHASPKHCLALGTKNTPLADVLLAEIKKERHTCGREKKSYNREIVSWLPTRATSPRPRSLLRPSPSRTKTTGRAM